LQEAHLEMSVVRKDHFKDLVVRWAIKVGHHWYIVITSC
jgi:hypothetical protein